MEDGRAGSSQPFPTFAEPRISDMDETGGLGTPRLASNRQLAELQVMWWLIVKPSAWRAYIADKAPSISTDFVSGDLRWRNPADRETMQLILAGGVGWCIFSLGADAVTRILDLTRGHPHLLQSICYEIVNIKNEQPRERRSYASVEGWRERQTMCLSMAHCSLKILPATRFHPELACWQWR